MTAAVAVAAVLAGRLPPVWMHGLVRLEIGIAIALAVSMGRLGSLFGATLFIGVCYAAGRAALARLGLAGDDPLERSLLAIAAGIIFAGWVYLALAGLHVLYPVALWAAAAAFALSGRRHLAMAGRSAVRWVRPSRAAEPPRLAVRFALIVGGYLALLLLVWAFSPEVNFDALSYHLMTVREYFAAHGVVRPFAIPGYMAHMGEGIYGFARGLGGEGTPKIVSAAMLGLTALAAAALGRRLANPEAGIWAALLLMSTPLVFWLGTTAGVDLYVGFFLAASLLALFRARDEHRPAEVALAAAFGGAAVAAKMTALFAAPALAIAAVIDLARARRARWIAVAVAAALVAALPWYVSNFVFTGTPIYPMPSPLFPGKGDPAANAWFSIFGFGNSWRAALALPFHLIFRSRRFGEAVPGGGVGAAALLLPLAAAAAVAGRGRERIAGFALLAFGIGWWETAHLARYLVPTFAIFIPLALAAIPWSAARPRRIAGAAIAVLIVAQALVVPVEFWIVGERIPIRLATRQESSRGFLERAIPRYAAIEWVNARVAPGENVLTDGIAAIRFYSRAPLGATNDTANVLGLFRFPEPEVVRRVREGGYRWAIVPEAETESPREYLRTHGDLTAIRGRCGIYRLSP